MGTVGTKIVGMDVKKLTGLLNKALADEWLAYYQYWVGSKVVKGPMRKVVEAELVEHAEEELKHANMLAERILQLGGAPLLSPQDWIKQTNCGYDAPKNPNVKTILKQNIKGEQCAILTYKKLLDDLKKADDPITSNMIRKIMEDEVEHEDDLQAIEEDMRSAK
ncbi:MAG TPA: ferritin [Candidatus Altiarchaeales archaeon]|nr:ferritin [Candidatus Altiarchaeales archaeon]